MLCLTGELRLLYVAAVSTGLLVDGVSSFLSRIVAGNWKTPIDRDTTCHEIGVMGYFQKLFAEPPLFLLLAQRETKRGSNRQSKPLPKLVKYLAVSILAVVWLAALGTTCVEAQGKSPGAKIRLATPPRFPAGSPAHAGVSPM